MIGVSRYLDDFRDSQELVSAYIDSALGNQLAGHRKLMEIKRRKLVRERDQLLEMLKNAELAQEIADLENENHHLRQRLAAIAAANLKFSTGYSASASQVKNSCRAPAVVKDIFEDMSDHERRVFQGKASITENY